MKEKLYRFMYGRYGVDQLNKALMIGAFVFIILQVVTGVQIFYFIGLILWGFEFFRMMSRNYAKRSKENEAWLNVWTAWKHRFVCIQKNMKDKEYRYFTCPSCARMVRVPRGKGKVEITCPSCRKSFDRKS